MPLTIGNILLDFEKCLFGGAEGIGADLCVGADAPLLRICMRTKPGEQIILDGRSAVFLGVQSAGNNTLVSYEFAESKILARLSICAIQDGINFRLSVENAGSDKVEWVEFAPVCVQDKLEGDGGKGKILLPLNEGVLISKHSDRDRTFMRYQEPQYPSQGNYTIYPNMIQSQFLAYLSDNKGVYLGAHDEKSGVKSIDYIKLNDCICMRIRVYSDVNFGENFITGYDTVVKFFNGDWHNAADIYYDWFSHSIGKKLQKISSNRKLPDWYKNSPIVVTYPVRGVHDTDEMTPNNMYPYTNATKNIKEISELTHSSIMALLMHWEGTAPWAPPYVWPPFGGEDNFLKFCNELHNDGNLLGVYCSGLGWTQQSRLIESYNCEAQFESENLSKIMCSAPDGKLPLSNICTAQRSGYDLCPACSKTKEIIVSEIKKIAAAGVDYVQVLDQNHGGNSYFCYSQYHGHNPGPGNWQIIAMRDLLKQLCNLREGLMLGCESAAADCFLDVLQFSDNRFELNLFIGQCVPLYAYLYHEYVNNFMGNQVCMLLKPTETNYLYRLAYSFAAGDMATIVIDQNSQIAQNWGQCDFSILPDRTASLRLLKNVNAWRRGYASKYLLEGKMLKPDEIICEMQYIAGCEDFDDIREQKIISSKWRASDGSVAQFAINYNMQPCVFKTQYKVKLWSDPHNPHEYKIYNSTEIEVPSCSAVLFQKCD